MSDIFSAMSLWMADTLGLNVANYPAPQQGQQQQQAASDVQQQMQLDAQKQQEERWKIQQEQQTKIFEAVQEVETNKAKTEDKAFNAFDGYIRN